MQVNLLTKVRFTLRTLKYYFEVFLHLKAKKLWFLNICSKIFRFRNCYERVLFLCAIFVRKCRLKKNESQFFDNCGGPRGYLGLQTIKYSMKPSPFTPYSFSMKVGSPSHSRQLVAKSKSVVNELGSPLWSRKTVSVSDDRHGKDDLFEESRSFRVLFIGPKLQNFHNETRTNGADISWETFRKVRELSDFWFVNHILDRSNWPIISEIPGTKSNETELPCKGF